MKRIIHIAIILLLGVRMMQAQQVPVYIPVSPDRISATASSHLGEFPPANAVNGSGMTGEYHQSDNLGRTMWISEAMTIPVRANEKLRSGKAWLMCEFDGLEKGVDLLRLWNHNQNQHTRRGLQKVYIDYSPDGKTWTPLKNGKDDFFIVPEAIGRKQEPASLSIVTGGIDIKFLCITIDDKQGNHYHDNNPETFEKVREMNQNPHYSGLAEIRFYCQKVLPMSEIQSVDSFEFRAGQGYLRTDEGPAREFTLSFSAPVYAGGIVTVKTGDKVREMKIDPSPSGIARLHGTLPVGYMEETSEVTVNFSGPQGMISRKLVIPAARKWKLYFIPHSHLDIGYTHRQQEVMDLQIRNLELALKLVEKTRKYPEGSRYKWNAEATWAVDGFLRKHSRTSIEHQFMTAVRNGDIGLDATLGSILTGISKQEELMHFFDDAHQIAKATGTEINTAMMSDVPGQSWGLVTAMAENGVRYFSSGPNYVPTLGRLGSHGVGLYNLIWGDVPFWWESQSGTHKILYWQTGKGYSMFHGWLMDRLSVSGTEPIWDYLQELEMKEYPYGLTYLRYTIHGDNGPPDEDMPEVVREWNQKYESPQFVIGTSKELFTEMEELYGDYLPTFSGDMTPIWEDGAASTARELAMNRASAERLNQYEILWSMTRKGTEIPDARLKDAWKNVVFFSEHTWGAAASGPQPEAQFTKDVWSGKKLFADRADSLSRGLYHELVDHLGGTANGVSVINVFNTNLWPRSDIVKVEGIDLTGKSLMAATGEVVPVQKLHEGAWVFYAKEIKPLSSTSFQVVTATNDVAPSMVDGLTMHNDRVRLVIDKEKGTIQSLVKNGSKHEFVRKDGLNQYIYSGRNGENVRYINRVKAVRVLDDGAVAATIRIESDAPGCRSLVSDITIYRDIDRIDIVNTLDKLNIYEHENVRFFFPFNFANPEVTMDLAMSEMHPEREQLVSSNKNFYSILNGLSVADLQKGIYMSTLDAPFVELGSMTADLSRTIPEATGWLNAATVSSDVFSWVMNNRWRTNYKASQEGMAAFRYSIQTFDPLYPDLKRYGMEQAQPLVAVASDHADNSDPLFRIKGNNRLILSTIRPSADGNGYIVRLQNASPLSAHAALESGRISIESAWVTDNREITANKFDFTSFWLKPFECVTIKLNTK